MISVLKGCSSVSRSANLLISARSMTEVRWVIESGVKWLDLKEPDFGSLGRPPLASILELTQLTIPPAMQVSIAGGELTEWSSELNETLASKLPSRFHIKLALANCLGTNWHEIVSRISKSLLHASQLILVHYADATRAIAPEWNEVIQVAYSLGCHYVLVDTHNKKLGGLLDYYSVARLKEMIQMAHEFRLSVALAGSLKLNQLESLTHLGAEWLGVRGAVCKNTERTGSICQDRLQQALSMFPTHSRNEPQ